MAMSIDHGAELIIDVHTGSHGSTQDCEVLRLFVPAGDVQVIAINQDPLGVAGDIIWKVRGHQQQ
jgi:hypothetical protein